MTFRVASSTVAAGRMAYWLHRGVAVTLVILAGCADGPMGTAAALPGLPTAAVAQAQSVQAVTTSGAAVTAGLVAAPANPSNQFVVVGAPAHGSVTVSGTTFTYTPMSGYVGTDGFQYVVAGDATASVPAMVTIEVLSTTVAPPSLATACTDLGPAFTPICTAISDVTTPLVQACSRVAPTDACSVFGGNKYGLVSACFDVITGQLAVACKAVGDALQLVASQCRVVRAPTDYCALYSGSAIGTPAINQYLAGPVHNALQQQFQLGLTLPLRYALVPATHNSFNFTDANVPPTLSGMDPDQLYSLTQQLDLDMRGLELDVHWFPHLGAPGGYAPILCHGYTNHLGCTFERTLAAGLQNIRSWLDAHPEAVIILDVEEHLNDPVDDVTKSFPAAAAAIESTLGRNSARDILFRPGQIQPGATCATQDIPLDVTLQQIQATGKQVLMYSSGCGHDPTGWDSIIFNESNRLQDEANAFGNSQYPNCHFTREQYQTSWTRFYDSSTLLDALTGAGSAQPVPPAEIQQMVRCGVNMPSINFLDPHTGQLEAFVWSWSYGQPLASTTQQCAVHNADGRFQAEACDQYLPYACLAADGWRISTTSGVFNSGATACAGSAFAVPHNGYQNELLKTAKAQAGVDRVWLAYTDGGDGTNWTAASTPPATRP
ncbi:MAG TPA: Ig-like domain-containing protein [Mycobacterium sp.]|nr:Ig-like domain-containing protein [Mycobacterium sp.]